MPSACDFWFIAKCSWLKYLLEVSMPLWRTTYPFCIMWFVNIVPIDLKIGTNIDWTYTVYITKHASIYWMFYDHLSAHSLLAKLGR